MDHIPIPQNPCNSRLYVPYLAQDHPELAYDGEGIGGLDAHMEPKLAALANGDTSQRDDTKELCLIQSWLYFGLLVEVMRIVGFEVSVNDFIRHEAVYNDAQNVRTYVSTASFPWRLRSWEERAQSLPDIERCVKFRLITERLQAVSDCFIELCEGGPTKTFFAPGHISDAEFSTRDLIALSIMILGEYLAVGSTLFLGDDGLPVEYSWSKISWIPSLKGRMLKGGWCKSEVNILADQGLGTSCLYYLSFVDQHSLNRDHSKCNASEEPENDFRCEYETLKVEEYVTEHVQGCRKGDSCKEIVSDQVWKPQVSQIIRRSQTPLVTVTEGPRLTDTKVSVFSAQEPSRQFQALSLWKPWKTWSYFKEVFCSYFGIMNRQSSLPEPSVVKYVCFSHVWADGLGNRRRNALPACQLVRLQNLANELYDPEHSPVPFWLDTISVPLRYPLRTTAIVNMWQNYQNADTVSVLDSSMLRESLADSSALQLLMSVRTSRWMRRLWTYQESYLAREIYYQFSDCSMDETDLIHEIIKEQIEEEDLMTEQGHIYNRGDDERSARLVYADSILYPALRWLSEQRQTESRVETSESRLSEILMPLCWRWTSRIQDEAICLSNLLNLPLDERAAIAEGDPSVRMKRLLSGLKYVPLTILFVDRERFGGEGCSWMPISLLGGGRSATMLSHLVATVTEIGLRFSSPGIVFPEHSTTITNNGSIIARDEEGRRFIHIETRTTIPFDATDLNSSQIAVVLREPFKYPDSTAGSIGALVVISQAQDDGELIVKYLHVVKVYSRDEFDDSGISDIVFKLLETTQRWTVQ